MDEPTQRPKQLRFGWIKTVSILLLGISAGLGLTLLTPKKPQTDWGMVIYSTRIIALNEKIIDYNDLAKRATLGTRELEAAYPKHLKVTESIQLVTSPRVPATINLSRRIPDTADGIATMYRFDFIPTVIKGRVTTNLVKFQHRRATRLRFNLGPKEIRVIAIHDGKRINGVYEYAIIEVVPVAPSFPSVGTMLSGPK